MPMKKILTIMLAGMFVLFLAGCGNKNVNTGSVTPVVSPKNNNSADSTKDNASAQSDDVSQKMPNATGKVDDTVNAIIDSSTSEGAVATSTDSDAQAVVGNGDDTNNLNKTYDENAL